MDVTQSPHSRCSITKYEFRRVDFPADNTGSANADIPIVLSLWYCVKSFIKNVTHVTILINGSMLAIRQPYNATLELHKMHY